LRKCEGRQFFIDAGLLDKKKTSGVSIVMNRPRKAEVVLRSDRPWESYIVGAYFSACEDEGIYKMFYSAFDNAWKHSLCYAVSRDGINWEKPELGLRDYAGIKNTNILGAEGGEGTVDFNPSCPDQRFRFTHVQSEIEWGTTVWYSPDGLKWSKNEKVLLPFCCDTNNQILWDNKLQKWTAYLRGWRNRVDLSPKALRSLEKEENGPYRSNRRVVCRAEINDLLQPWQYAKNKAPFYLWGKEKKPAISLELPTILRADRKDPPNCDFYNPCYVKYKAGENVYFMFPSMYYHFPEPQDGGEHNNDGCLDIHMAVSRDGIKWDRISRQPFVQLEPSAEGEEDGQLYMGQGMLFVKDEVWMYYSGFSTTHGKLDKKTGKGVSVIRLLKIRLDGFASLDSNYEGGVAVTKPLLFEGKELELNIDTGAAGSARVGVLDEKGREIEGYGISDCGVINGNYIRKAVSWKGKTDVSRFSNKPVRLKFVSRSTKLFTFCFK